MDELTDGGVEEGGVDRWRTLLMEDLIDGGLD